MSTIETETLTLTERGRKISVETFEDYTVASEYLKGAVALDRQIQAHYAPLKKAAHNAHWQLVQAENQQREPLQTAIEWVKSEMLAYENREKLRAEQEQKKLQKAADKKLGDMAPVIQVAPQIPTVSGVSGRSNWKCVIDDPMLIPREYLIPNEAGLNALARRMKDGFNVPGCHAVNDQNKVVRT
jgi:hypothetical protein